MKKLANFMLRMDEILKEKSEKYKDLWEICNLGILVGKLKEQVNKLVITEDIENPKRTVLHIANYCLFIYNRLQEKSKGKEDDFEPIDYY